MAPHIAFRADASASMGAGHVSRCATLATSLKRHGCRITFVCAQGSSAYFPQVLEIADAVIELPHVPGDAGAWLSVPQSTDAAATIAALAGSRPDWLVVDQYGIDAAWEREVRDHAQRLLVIDDLADRPHACDVILDQNLRPDDGAAYDDLVEPATTVLYGPRYALLRDEFTKSRPHHVRRKVSRILVSFGGVDGANGTGTALTALAGIDTPVDVDVVIGAQHPAREDILATCAQLEYTCHVQTTSIADLMDAADLAIGAGGASSWERCIIGLPTVALVMAANQRIIAEELAARGAAINLGDHQVVQAADVTAAVMHLIANPPTLSGMSAAAYDVMADRIDVAEVLLATV
jgi:UDP-2,4-diacetamido-2,4,6-trideoxy-beta-L-altropyranose hydrolase